MIASDVAVTGVGLLAAVGLDAQRSWAAITAGSSGISRVTSVDADGFISQLAGELPGGSDWKAAVPRRAGRGGVDRCHAMALDATEEAVAGARLAAADYAPERVGISFGTSLGGARSGEAFHRQWLEEGLRRADASLLRQYPLHSVADYIAEQFGYTGPRTVQSNACAAGAVAIAYGVELIESGHADVVIAGGVDPLAYFSFGGFSCLEALDPLHCAPYTRSSGLNLGEGAGVVVLERRSAAHARGIPVLAVVQGYGLSADAHHPTAPDPTGRGALRAMRAALDMGGLSPRDVEYVNGHGTGTPANDSTETRAVAQLRPSDPPPLSSTKSMIGHTLGAAGAVEAVTTVLALRDGVFPPTVVPPDATDAPHGLDIVPAAGRTAPLSVALSNSFAFGGNNASLLLTRDDPAARRESSASTERPVVITGIAAIAADAKDSAEVRDLLREWRPAYGTQRVALEGYGDFPVAEIPEKHLTRGVNPQMLRRIDNLGRRSAIVVADLLRERKLSRDEAARTGLIFATGTGPLSTVEAFQRELIVTGAGSTRLFPNTVMNAAGGHVALLNRLQGPTATICAGGTSGISALHFATRLIQRGAADRMVVLSADEAPVAMLAAHARIDGFLSRERCLPFRDSGKVFGGAGVAVLLEAAATAPQEKTMGWIEGFGMTGDASGPGRLEASSDGWSRSFRSALVDAGVAACDVDVVVSAACGRAAIDDTETTAVRDAGLSSAVLSAPKEIFGDAGASSALLGVAHALWMSEETDDGALDRKARASPGRSISRRAIVSSYEVGGSYQSVVVRSRDA
ncbi:3-oxoacyl-[acyl-carrier-protein] synthase II [Microbacterium hydrothermale]|uniref:beta-ketoacyl-[acyl-carrier-protein] synthase family protein n=1 Tax=Microbacterium hydrothermale TaxID=857427 RepID=UPI002227FB44|nr:beta-ketoacyl-[acyl-carrier-protein] synthase family protein [Microbacterium hydrothermale]MCW2163718.1 3-oxoacyl-[acyl-carrier-protein] synthase II [Microbacterium hydrothermale]